MLDNKKQMAVVFMLLSAVAASLLTVGCGRKSEAAADRMENVEAKAMLQGIWADEISESIVFKIEGDTIFYPDRTSRPARFVIIGDTLVMGEARVKYPIVKHTAHLFSFKNPNGDVVRLVKSSAPNDTIAFVHDSPEPMTVSPQKLKTDTVVVYGGERYHCYIAVNPTTYKVVRTSYNNDGVKVENVYYDNIIHVSVYHGTRQLYSRDFTKQMYSRLVPGRFLRRAVLGHMEFGKVDARGFHFNSTICIPDGDSCYLLDTQITFDGEMSMELIEY